MKRKQIKATKRILQEKMHKALDLAALYADGLMTPVSSVVLDANGIVDSGQVLHTAKEILSYSDLSPGDKDRYEFCLSYLYCAMIILTMEHMEYDEKEVFDLMVPYDYSSPAYGQKAYTFYDLIKKAELLTVGGKNGFVGCVGEYWGDLIGDFGNRLAFALTGKRPVTPMEEWPELTSYFEAFLRETEPEENWWETPDGEEAYEAMAANESTPEYLEELEEQMREDARIKAMPVRTEKEISALYRRQRENLQLQYPEYKEFMRRMRLLDRLQRMPHPDFQKRMEQMISAWLREEDYGIYGAEHEYVEAMIHLRRAVKRMGGTL